MATKKIFKTREEILDLLERVFKVNSHLRFSQSHDELIKISWSLLQNINYYNYNMAIRPEDPLQSFDFKVDEQINVKNEGGSISFETQIKSFNHTNLVIVDLPEELELLDSRITKRYSFENFQTGLSFKNKSQFDYMHSRDLIQGRLLDISENGISLETQNTPNYQFQQSDRLYIQEINGYSPSMEISGEIVYLRNLGGTYRIGMRFLKKIPIKEILKYLKNKCYIQT